MKMLKIVLDPYLSFVGWSKAGYHHHIYVYSCRTIFLLSFRICAEKLPKLYWQWHTHKHVNSPHGNGKGMLFTYMASKIFLILVFYTVWLFTKMYLETIMANATFWRARWCIEVASICVGWMVGQGWPSFGSTFTTCIIHCSHTYLS